jgi:hypothetical protein
MPAPVSEPDTALPKTDPQISSTRSPRNITSQACAPLGTAALVTGTEIHSGPDPATPTIATLDHLTPACVGAEKPGFRFRRVLLADGTGGFVENSYVADLTRPPAQPPPAAVPARAVAPAPAETNEEDCSPLIPALVEEGATVHAGPDAQTRVIVRLDAATPVCAAAAAQGFGMRRVRLPDAREGSVKESDLSE